MILLVRSRGNYLLLMKECNRGKVVSCLDADKYNTYKNGHVARLDI